MVIYRRLYLLAFLFVFHACGEACLTKSSFLKAFDTFAQQDFTEIDPEEKGRAMERYEKFVLKCHEKYKASMTLDERQEFWRQAIQVYSALNEKALRNFFRDNPDPLEQYMQDELRNLIEESGDDLADDFKEMLKEELPKIIDNFMDEIEKLGEELKKMLEN